MSAGTLRPDAAIAAGPVAVELVAWRAGGVLRVTVIAKATFAFANDAAMPRTDPQPIFRAEVCHGNSPTRSVRFSVDRVPYLHHGEVLFTGHAHAPGGPPVEEMPVRLGVFDGARALLDKTLRVRRKGGVEGVPLAYEHAYGGPGFADNPYGIGAVKGSGDPEVSDPNKPGNVAGFAPIGEFWPARRRRLGSQPRPSLRAEIVEIPEGFDWSYFQAAPPDQWTDFLGGGEWIVMEGLHPTLPRARMRLPGARGLARVHGLSAFGVAEGQPLALHADMLRVDGDEQRCTLTFRGVFPLASEAALAAVRVVAGVELPAEPIPWPVELTEGAPDDDAIDVSDDDLESTSEFHGTLVLSETRVASRQEQGATPFRPGLAPETVARASAPAAPAPPSDTITLSGNTPAPDTLPFHPGSSAPSAPSAPPAIVDEETAIFDAGVAGMSTLPFSPALPGQSLLAVPSASPPVLKTVVMDDPSDSTMALSELGDLPSIPVLPFQGEAASGPRHPDLPPRPAPEAEAPTPPAPDAPAAVPASHFFHEIHRPALESTPGETETETEAVPELPPRRTDAVPLVFEHDAHRRGPVTASTIAWQLRPPRDSLTVVAKSSFDLVHGGAATLRAEADLLHGEVFTANDRQRSLVHASDFAHFKARADVVVRGHAHAGHGAAPVVDVRLRFGRPGGGAAFERSIRVFGERRWQRLGVTLKPTEPIPFEAMPLTYEGAFGGPEFPANPVGVGHRTKGDAVGSPLPHLEDPEHLVGSPSDTPAPACFGPVPMAWKERWSRLGTYDAAWLKERWPYFAGDMDPSFFQAAPAPQQIAAVHGDELFEIAGMHPSLPVLRGSLPGQRARGFAQRTAEAGGGFSEIELRLDTVSFDVDAMKLDLVWRGVIEVSDDDAPEIGALFVFLEPLGAPATLAEARARLAKALRAAAEPRERPPQEEAPRPDEAAERRRASEAARAQENVERELDEKGAAEKAKIEGALRAKGLTPERIAEMFATAEQETRTPPVMPVEQIVEQLRRAKVPEEEISAMVAEMQRPAKEPPPAPPDPSARERVERLLAAGEPLDGLDLAGADLSELDFRGRSLVRANLARANLVRSNLSGAKLSQAQLGGADLTGASLEGADLTLADLFGATVQGARFTGAVLTRADLSEAHGEKADFQGARGQGARFARGQWAGARFDGAELPLADFTGALLDDASFARATMPEVRLQEARATQASFDEARMPGARASDARLVRCSFRALHAPRSAWIGAELDGSDFTGAKLAGSAMIRASCRSANLSAVDLSEARLDRARLSRAVLLKSNLRAASLQHADLGEADLRGANLYSCNTFRAGFAGARLDGAIVAKSGPMAPVTKPPAGRA